MKDEFITYRCRHGIVTESLVNQRANRSSRLKVSIVRQKISKKISSDELIRKFIIANRVHVENNSEANVEDNARNYRC